VIRRRGISDSQRRVVEHPLDRPAVVAAGAGTGKTFTIVERVAALHESGRCPADRILLLTFARKAAAELRARIKRRLGEDAPFCYTFHAFAWHILQTHAYDIGITPETEVIEDAEARVEFRKAFDGYLADTNAAASGFPLRPYNRDEIRTALFALDQRIKQEGRTLEEFRSRALAAAEAFARTPYRELRERYRATRSGRDYKVVTSVTDLGLAQEIAWERERIQASFEILRRFAARLRERHALTYGDLLLCAERAVREHPRLRNELRAQYRACVVDEYQDTDRAQHRLLEAIFGESLSRVMVVGDSLQSIFSFRGAHPENVKIFERAQDSVTYSLVENRRSRQEILDLAHTLIAAGHGDAQRLQGERGEAGSQIVHVSTLWTKADGTRPSLEEARELEAQAIAQRIAAILHSGELVDVDGQAVPVAPKHVAILSRTKRNVGPLTDALLDAGIPFKLVGGVGFYDAPEIRDSLAWLRLLADPLDSPAAARVLESAAIGASDAAVARLATGLQRGESAFARRVLVEDLPEGDELDRAAKVAADAVRRKLDELAPYAALPVMDVLRAVLDTVGIEQFYRTSSDPRAAAALANLSKLEGLARSFAQSTPGAHAADFVAFIEELEGVDFDEREADVSDQDAVTIATIHAAKGLEWPIVFLASVWPQGQNDPRLILDDATGAFVYGENPDGTRSFHYIAVERHADDEGYLQRMDERGEDLEERRLLYVAATRARDRLFISGVRRAPSKQNPMGKPHAYVAEACEWMHSRGWPIDEPMRSAAQASALPTAGPSVSPNGIAPSIVAAAPSSGPPPRETSLNVPLSYSFIARFEQCPRQATYKRMLRLPETAIAPPRRPGVADGDEGPIEAPPPNSLLAAGEYGLLLHTALEHWALNKRAGVPLRDAGAYVRGAQTLLHLEAPEKQFAHAHGVLSQLMERLQDWQPVAIEAPFVLDFGREGRPLLVTGYIDLLARDGAGDPCLVDYKTGDPTTDHALQLALYKRAAAAVYAVEPKRCFIAQISGSTVTLNEVVAVSDAVLERRIAAVCRGLLTRDVRARPGAWCWSCGYRGAPCLDYKTRH
jgi:ATP-dependent helicase/nuclease subunit A